MAIEKKITKKAVPKAAVKKVAAVKPAVVKPAAPKAGAKKAPVKKVVSKKQTISQERFYAMVSEAAYFASQNDGNRKGSVEYWMEAEAAVRAKFNVA